MAEVWSGKTFGSGGFEKIVAIKILSKDQIDQTTCQSALTDEALLGVHLQHPNIVDIYDLNLEGDPPFLVMEYIEGIELRDLLKTLRHKKENLPFPLSCHIVMEVAKALDHAHQTINPKTGNPFQIVHRDVSTSNILISREGEVKLADFGIAKSTLQSLRTQTGVIKGKFRYMSPEQARGENIDFRSDIFSLGLIFMECVTGTPVYNADTDIRVFAQAQSAELQIPDGLPLPLKEIFQKLLAEIPGNRYSNLAMFCDELGDYLGKTTPPQHGKDLKKFLVTQKIPAMERAVQNKRTARDCTATSGENFIDETGRFVTVTTPSPAGRKKYYLWSGISALILVVGMTVTFLRQNRSLQPVAVPKVIEKPISQKSKSNIPIPATLKITANPYAEVTIPGEFEDRTTPFEHRLSPGIYTLIFLHPTSQRRATTQLEVKKSGSYFCMGEMISSDPASPPNVQCGEQ